MSINIFQLLRRRRLQDETQAGSRLTVPRTLLGTILEITCGICVLLLWVFAILHFSQEVLVVAVVCTLVSALMLAGAYRPTSQYGRKLKVHNYRQAMVAATVVRIMAIETVGLLFMVAWEMSHGNSQHAGDSILPIIGMAVLLLTNIVGATIIYRLRNE